MSITATLARGRVGRTAIGALGLVVIAIATVGCIDDEAPSTEGSAGTLAPSMTVTTTPPDPDARLTVDDAQGVGAVGDGALSLAEAIRLANGELTVERLSGDERARVSGAPGRNSADLIEFDLPGRSEVTAPEQEPSGSGYFATEPAFSALPPLVGNDGDRIDGGGVTLANGSARVIGGVGLVVSSSNVVIESLTLQRFLTGVEIAPVDERPLEGVQLRGNRIEGGGGVSVRATSTSGVVAVVRGLAIADNELSGPAEMDLAYPYFINQAISLQALTDTALRDGDGEAAMEDVAITGNVIRAFPNGIGVSAVTGAADVAGLAARLTDIRIEGNDIEMQTGSFDPAIYLWGASNTGGEIENVTVEDVSLVGNQLASNGHVVLATASEQVLGNDMRSHDIDWDGLSIMGNTMGPVDACDVGMMVASSFQEITTGSAATAIAMSDVLIEDNAITCDAGLILSPAVNFGSGAIGEGISLDDVTVRANRFEVDSFGALVAGGRVIETILGGAESSPDALVRDNTFTGLSVDANDLTSGRALLRAYGGVVAGAPGRAVGNRLLGLQVGDNRLADGAAACRVVVDEPGRHGGSARGNQVDPDPC